MQTVYLAGPDVFLPDALEVGRRKVAICERFGFRGLFPIDNEGDVVGDPAQIYLANCERMRAATAAVFNLTPFRGPSADAGTVFELGYVAALGKAIAGYAGVEEDYLRRVERACGPVERRGGAGWDRDGYLVEDFGLFDNLMLARSVAEAGGEITLRAEPSLAAFAAFEACVERLRARVPLD